MQRHHFVQPREAGGVRSSTSRSNASPASSDFGPGSAAGCDLPQAVATSPDRSQSAAPPLTRGLMAARSLPRARSRVLGTNSGPTRADRTRGGAGRRGFWILAKGSRCPSALHRDLPKAPRSSRPGSRECSCESSNGRWPDRRHQKHQKVSRRRAVHRCFFRNWAVT